MSNGNVLLIAIAMTASDNPPHFRIRDGAKPTWFFADLHIHSKFSRATGKDANLEHMALWARKKGVTVVGTGDFTHPQWMKELRKKLVPAEPGMRRLPMTPRGSVFGNM